MLFLAAVLLLTVSLSGQEVGPVHGEAPPPLPVRPLATAAEGAPQPDAARAVTGKAGALLLMRNTNADVARIVSRIDTIGHELRILDLRLCLVLVSEDDDGGVERATRLREGLRLRQPILCAAPDADLSPYRLAEDWHMVLVTVREGVVHEAVDIGSTKRQDSAAVRAWLEKATGPMPEGPALRTLIRKRLPRDPAALRAVAIEKGIELRNLQTMRAAARRSTLPKRGKVVTAITPRPWRLRSLPVRLPGGQDSDLTTFLDEGVGAVLIVHSLEEEAARWIQCVDGAVRDCLGSTLRAAILLTGPAAQSITEKALRERHRELDLAMPVLRSIGQIPPSFVPARGAAATLMLTRRHKIPRLSALRPASQSTGRAVYDMIIRLAEGPMEKERVRAWIEDSLPGKLPKLRAHVIEASLAAHALRRWCEAKERHITRMQELEVAEKAAEPPPVTAPPPELAEMWRTRLGFEEVTVPFGVEQQIGIGGRGFGPLWADFDGDSWIDLLFLNHYQRPSVYRNQEGKGFSDHLVASEIRTTNFAYKHQNDRHGAAAGDYDNDGDLDLFISHGAKGGRLSGKKWDELLRNDGNFKFTEVTLDVGAHNDSGRGRLPTWVDVDNDGWLDLYVGNLDSPNVLYLNKGGKTFDEVTDVPALNLVAQGFPAWFDLDDDFRPDLMLVAPVALLHNEGNGKFTEATEKFIAEPNDLPGPRGVSPADYDCDGDTDIFIASVVPDGSRLLLNDDGMLRNRPIWLGPRRGERHSGVAAGDIDNDGDVDLVTVGSGRISVFENQDRATRFVPRSVPEQLGLVLDEACDLEIADLDNDGFLDIAISAADRQIVLRNTREGKERHWLSLGFVGKKSNRMGIGVKVKTTIPGKDGDQIVFREYVGDTGFTRSAGAQPMHLGLGAAKTVDLEIRWPSGTVQKLTGVEVNRHLVVREP